MKRRHFIQHSLLFPALMRAAPPLMAGKKLTEQESFIKALVPRDESGHQFILYSDSTSGQKGLAHESNHRKVIDIIQKITPEPAFIAQPGDAVMHGEDESQWRHWWHIEMKWLKDKKYPLYQSTSNHHVYSKESEDLFKKHNPQIPQNGPEGFKGLAYWIRKENLLYVSTHQPDRRRYQQYLRMDDTAWLDEVLAMNRDADYKFVAGHYPVYPVNGYLENPRWCFKPDERKGFWDTLVRHGVDAYLCSHIIAFDTQIHQGIPQICSGGAGTTYGYRGMMPGTTEYYHATQIAVDKKGLRYQVLDVHDKMRESLSWPFSLGKNWRRVNSNQIAWAPAMDHQGNLNLIRAIKLNALRLPPEPPANTLYSYQKTITLLSSDENRFWLGIDLLPGRLHVNLKLDGPGEVSWLGPPVTFSSAGETIELAFHPALGPGGILWRWSEKHPWNSMETTSASGLERFSWPALLYKKHPSLHIEIQSEVVKSVSKS